MRTCFVIERGLAPAPGVGVAVTVICVYWSEWAAPSAAVSVRVVRVFVPGTGFGLKDGRHPRGEAGDGEGDVAVRSVEAVHVDGDVDRGAGENVDDGLARVQREVGRLRPVGRRDRDVVDGEVLALRVVRASADHVEVGDRLTRRRGRGDLLGERGATGHVTYGLWHQDVARVVRADATMKGRRSPGKAGSTQKPTYALTDVAVVVSVPRSCGSEKPSPHPGRPSQL